MAEAAPTSRLAAARTVWEGGPMLQHIAIAKVVAMGFAAYSQVQPEEGSASHDEQ